MYKKIILVDDEANILKSLQRELTPWAHERGIAILTCGGGQQAIDALVGMHGHVDLLISDLRMPQMNGAELITEVHKRWPHVISILLTAFSEIEDVMTAVRAGIFSYILKPWDSNQLIADLERALEMARIKSEHEENQKRLETELKWAGEMQRTMLSVRLPESERIGFAVTYKPLQGLWCGGDYYDVITINKNKFLILVGDVAGHGVTGALVTGILKSVVFSEYVRAHIDDISTSAFLGWLNRRMLTALQQSSGLIITFAAALLDLSTMSLDLSLAGQNPPILARDGMFLQLEPGDSGPGLGFDPDATYIEKRWQLSAGDQLWLFTDALTEVAGGDGKVGTERLIATLQELGTTLSADSADSHKVLCDTVLSKSGYPAYADDLTVLGCKIRS